MQIVEHHIKYKEIHGVDETVFITKSEHSKLHRRLRKEGKCNIPVDILHKISIKAERRTEKGKNWYQDYNKKAYQIIHFQERLMRNVVFYEYIKYNNITGVVTYSARFAATNKKELYQIAKL